MSQEFIYDSHGCAPRHQNLAKNLNILAKLGRLLLLLILAKWESKEGCSHITCRSHYAACWQFESACPHSIQNLLSCRCEMRKGYTFCEYFVTHLRKSVRQLETTQGRCPVPLTQVQPVVYWADVTVAPHSARCCETSEHQLLLFLIFDLFSHGRNPLFLNGAAAW